MTTRHALVTGGCSGIGLEIARELAGRGYPLLLVSNRDAELEAAAREIAVSYGVKIDAIRLLNGIPEGDTFLYVGQRLLIWPAGTAEPSFSESTSTAQAAASETSAASSLPTISPSRPGPLSATPSPSPAAFSAAAVPSPAHTAPVRTSAPAGNWDIAQQNVSMLVLAVLILAIIGVLGGILFGLGKSQPPR